MRLEKKWKNIPLRPQHGPLWPDECRRLRRKIPALAGCAAEKSEPGVFQHNRWKADIAWVGCLLPIGVAS